MTPQLPHAPPSPCTHTTIILTKFQDVINCNVWGVSILHIIITSIIKTSTIIWLKWLIMSKLHQNNNIANKGSQGGEIYIWQHCSNNFEHFMINCHIIWHCSIVQQKFAFTSSSNKKLKLQWNSIIVLIARLSLGKQSD